MNIFLYGMLFIMGTFFGSFFTLAVYRIPLKKDITHEHSFCPNCNHKLGMLDLIPVWSYLALKGKCRYCKEKVRIRYFILEILSGFVFVISFLSLHVVDIFTEINKIAYFISFVFQYITLVLIAGIDKEHHNIHSSILLFGSLCQLVYMLYLYVIGATSMYRYIIYFILIAGIFILLKIVPNKFRNYWMETALLLIYIELIINLRGMLLIVFLSIMVSFVLRIVEKQKYPTIKQTPMGFILSFSTIVYMIVENFIKFWNR